VIDASPPVDPSSLAEGTSALLTAPDRETARDQALASLADVEDHGALVVSTDGARRAVDRLRRQGIAADAIAAVDASPAGEVPDGIAGGAAVDGPGALPQIGVAASDHLERLDHRYERVIVLLDSTSDLVGASSLPGAFRFLHVLTGRVRTADAVLVATLDSSEHDEETRRTLAELFDEVVAVEEDRG